MKQLLTTSLLFLLSLSVAAQMQEKQITVTENVAYRTDVGPKKIFIGGDISEYEGFTIQHKNYK